jgi:Leucine-rich repeat (LRR) protein
LDEISDLGSEFLYGPKLAQRFALSTLNFSLIDYNMTAAPNNFGVTDIDECYWQGVTCVNETVTELKYGDFQKSGTIPPELGILTDLTYLDLSKNMLFGSIPEKIYDLTTQLEYVYLYQNQLTGTISDRIGNLTNMTHLHLSHNQLTGSLPLTMRSGNNSDIKPYRK